MTEAGALRFLRNCERFWLGGRFWLGDETLSLEQVYSKTKDSCRKMIPMMLILVCFITVGIATATSGFMRDFDIFCAGWCFLTAAAAGWLLFRLRDVQEALLRDSNRQS